MKRRVTVAIAVVLLVILLSFGLLSTGGSLTEKFNCIENGGTWRGFSNAGADICGQQNSGADVIIGSCDCGPDKCWDGKNCMPG